MKDEMMFFRRNAILGGLCKEYDGKWASCHGDKVQLMRLVLCCQSAPYFASFCHNGAGLSKEYCKKEFGEYINGYVFDGCDGVSGYSYQLFIDAPDDVETNFDVAQFLWCKNLNVTVPQTKCPRMYISNGSCIHLSLDGFNSPMIYLFDDSKVIIDDADENSAVTVFRYSSKAKVEIGKYCFAKVKDFEKTLKI